MPAKKFASNHASAEAISALPRYMLEAIAFGGILLMILYLMSKTGIFSNVLPIVSLYVFAGYRLMPALHQVYSSLAKITFAGPTINRLYEDIESLSEYKRIEDQNVLRLDRPLQKRFYL